MVTKLLLLLLPLCGRELGGGQQPRRPSAVTGPNDSLSGPICLMAYSASANKDCQTVKTSEFIQHAENSLSVFQMSLDEDEYVVRSSMQQDRTTQSIQETLYKTGNIPETMMGSH